VQNLNNTYYETLDENFKQALKFYETNYSHQQLIDMLKHCNVVQKQIAALRLDAITSKSDAKILTDNLTGQDGKIREAVSLKLKEFMADSTLINYFKDTDCYKKFLDAIIDINGNICRNIISAVSNLKNDENFCSIFCPKLLNLTSKLTDTVSQFDFSDGKYKVNKEAFKLYWCLETIYVFFDCFNIEELKPILMKTKNIGEYTIREKTAKILTNNFEDKDLSQIKAELKNDSNYYVRRF
jgi:hypothetical protein